MSMNEILVSGYYISVIGFIIGLLLSNKSLGNSIVELWYRVSVYEEFDHKEKVLAITGNIIRAIYQNEKSELSIKKLVIIAFMLNAPFLVGLSLSSSSDFEIDGWSALFLFIILLSIAVFVFETISYKITIFFINKARKLKKLRFIAFDVLALICTMYILPMILIMILHENVSNEVLAIVAGVTPIFPVVVMFSTESHSDLHFYLMLPAIFSVALPSMFFMLSVISLYNRHILSMFARVLSYVSALDGVFVRNTSLILFTFCTGSMSVLSQS